VKLRFLSRAVCCVVLASPAAAVAQTHVTVPVAPKPDQVLHVTTTQEFAITMGALPGQTAPAPQIVTRSVLGFTQSNGKFDTEKRMTQQITVERLEAQQSLNGTTKSSPNVNAAVGQTLTASLDASGKLVDLKMPGELQAVSVMLKQLIAGTYGPLNALAPKSMAIGETATVDAPVPLRLPGSTGSYQTRTLVTLRGIEKRGADRIAHFEQRIEAVGDTDKMTLTGKGTIDMNVDKGFVPASTTEWNLAGETSTGDIARSINATIKIATTATE